MRKIFLFRKLTAGGRYFHRRISRFLKRYRHNKYVVYTIILGSYDDLKEPETIHRQFDYICFTNRDDLVTPTWNIKKISCNGHPNFKRCAAELIIYPFDVLKQYEISILVGGQISIHCDIGEFLRNNLPKGYGLSVSRHPVRDCLYEEAKAVVGYKKGDPQIIGKQIAGYRNAGMPEHAGLIETGVMIRRHNDKNVIQFCELWLAEVRQHSQRDQLSFPYILWKYNLIKPHYFRESFREHGFKVNPHKFEQTF